MVANREMATAHQNININRNPRYRITDYQTCRYQPRNLLLAPPHQNNLFIDFLYAVAGGIMLLCPARLSGMSLSLTCFPREIT